MYKLFKFPIYLPFFAIFPIYGLLAHNIREIQPSDSFRLFLVSLTGAGILLFFLWLIHRDWSKAALISALVIVLFFSYGHIYSLIEGQVLLGINITRHRYLAFLWLIIMIFGWRWIISRTDTNSLTVNLSLIGLALLLYPTYQIMNYRVEILWAHSNDQKNSADVSAEKSVAFHSSPDIYYIVLDAYTRDDTMLDFYKFDNTPFINALESRGFFVARCSQSNYARTFLSLTSSLNLNYLQVIYPSYLEGKLNELIKHNKFRSITEEAGYKSVAVKSGFVRTDWDDADVYLSPQRVGGPNTGRVKGLNDFEAMVFNTTAGLFLLDANKFFGGHLEKFVNESPKFERYQKIEFVLDSLEKVHSIEGPKLVFAHVLIPHEPYIFDKDGNFLPDQEDYVPGYGDQVTYLNKRILSIIDIILANSNHEPVIILQGDHGGGETKGDHRRLHILNAYYLPYEEKALLYPTITPINTFRFILNHFLGLDYDLLPDKSYYSHSKTGNFNFTEVPVSRPGCEDL